MLRIFFILLMVPSILLAVKSEEELRKLSHKFNEWEAAGEKFFNEQFKQQAQAKNASRRRYRKPALLRLLITKSSQSTAIKSK